MALAQTISPNGGERDISFALTQDEYRQVMRGTAIGDQAMKRVRH